MSSEELRSFYDITVEEDRSELAEFIKKGTPLNTTLLVPEDLSDVIPSIKDLVQKIGGEVINVDTSRWPSKLIVIFRCGEKERKLILDKVEEGAYKPILE